MEAKPIVAEFGSHFVSLKRPVSEAKQTVSSSTSPPQLRADPGAKCQKYECQGKECSHKSEAEGGAGSGPHGVKVAKPIHSKPTTNTVATAIDLHNSKIKGQKQSESSKFNFQAQLKESISDPLVSGLTGKRFRVTMLEEGMGNFGDCFYYTAPAIGSCPPLFEGKHLFVDHPSSSEEMDRPERSVKDIAGYFENCAAELDPTDGVTRLMGDLVMVSGDAFARERALMVESLNYSLKHPGDALIGLSINASGDFTTVAMEQFLKDNPVPEVCKPKLVEALQRGITMIRPVQEMKSAVSCDLVTTAGAGGKINQILEGEKSMAKKENEQESKKEAGLPDDAAAPGDDASHADASQDQDLIMKMLKKYVGDGFSDDDKSMASEAHKNALEMGLEGEEAMKCAGMNMKMAKHLQMKQAKAQPQPGADGQPSQESLADGANGAPSADVKAKPVGPAGSVSAKDQVESTRAETVMKLTARVAQLEQERDSMKLAKHMKESLETSKLPRAVTAKFTESFKDFKSIAEFDKQFKTFKDLFKEAQNLRNETGTGFILSAEKTGATEAAANGFSDCLED